MTGSTAAGDTPEPQGRFLGGGLLLVAIAQLSLTLPLARHLSIWIDEAYTLSTTGSGPGHALRQAVGFELQPPGYYFALSLWRELAPGLFGARLFSVACAVSAVGLVAAASRRVLPELWPGWAALVLAFAPGTLKAAVDARPYAMALAVAAALVWALEPAFLSGKGHTAWRAAFAALACLAVYTQYYLAFLLLAIGVAVWLTRGTRAFAVYVLCMLPALASLAPLLGLLGGQVTAHTVASTPLRLGQALGASIAAFEEALLPVSTLADGRLARWMLRALFALPLLALVAFNLRETRARDAFRARGTPLAVVSFVVVIVFLALCVRFGPDIASGRHALFLLPVLVLLLFAGLVPGPARRAAACGAAWLLGWFAYANVFAYRDLAKEGDHARVAEYLLRHERPGQPILVFVADNALALRFHYQGANRILPIPEPVSLRRYDPRAFAWQSREHVASVLRAVLEGAADFWLVTYSRETADTGSRGGLLEAEIDERYEVVQQERFKGATLVRLLRARVR